ncbi:MAG: hypothetical protein ABEJ03_05620 [Candidatus Nanohaloarchaea archaeon]
MNVARYGFVLGAMLVLVAGASAEIPQSCQPLDGDRSGNSVDLLLVMGGYSEDVRAEQHARYFAGFKGTDRGLMDLFPMNVTEDRFEILYVGARDNSNDVGGSNGPFREARYQRKQCGADYAVYMARGPHGWTTGAKDLVARVKGISDKVAEDNGAVGLIHEWGHIFGDVSDEYDFNAGKRDGNFPNCAKSKSQAEKWWGEMAETTDSVGYANGCKNSDDMIEPHPGGTIMGDKGLWHYGPVNDRNFLKNIAEETGPVTDLSVESVSRSGTEIEAKISYETASNVAEVSLENADGSKKIFVHGTGSENVTIDAGEKLRKVELSVDTVDDIKEINEDNNRLSKEFGATADYWKSKYMKASQKLEESRDRVSELESRVSGLESDLADVRQRLDEARSTIAGLRSRNSNLSEQLNETGGQESTGSSTEEQRSNSSSRNAADDQSSRISELQAENSRLEGRVSSLRSELSTARETIDSLREALRAKASESGEDPSGGSSESAESSSGDGKSANSSDEAEAGSSQKGGPTDRAENNSTARNGSVGSAFAGILSSLF